VNVCLVKQNSLKVVMYRYLEEVCASVHFQTEVSAVIFRPSNLPWRITSTYLLPLTWIRCLTIRSSSTSLSSLASITNQFSTHQCPLSMICLMRAQRTVWTNTMATITTITEVRGSELVRCFFEFLSTVWHWTELKLRSIFQCCQE
jgi:hypothetical protein